ncbi:MAG: hypothetical protein HUJ65_03285 [Oscillospiraceae bacterium]|nr:hypothetical protein [Oscillospiraceae bacterium]
MGSIADRFTLKLGDAEIKGTRLTLRELKEHSATVMADRLDVEAAAAIVESHATYADGSKLDAMELSIDQMKRLIAEMVLPKEGRSIADFIAALC